MLSPSDIFKLDKYVQLYPLLYIAFIMRYKQNVHCRPALIC